MTEVPLLIQDLRERTQDVLTTFYDTDFNLERFIIGCKYDMEEAERKLRKHLNIRKIMNLDDAPETFKINPILLKYYPNSSLNTLAKDGTLIHIQAHAKTDNHGLMQSLTYPDYYKSRIYYAERGFRQILEQEALTGKRTMISLIFDVEGFSFDPSLVSIFQGPYGRLIDLLTENYVELLKRIYVVNEPSYAYAMWKILEPFIPSRTKDKIMLLGSDWKTAIHEYIPPESLPIRWGGTLDADDKVVIPTDVPTSLYLPANPEVEEKMTTEYVAAGTTLVLKFLPPADAKILKYFIHQDGELVFCIHRSCHESETVPDDAEQVYPEFVFQYTYAAPSSDVVDCSAGGIYYLSFKNNGWFFSKTVRYFVDFE